MPDYNNILWKMQTACPEQKLEILQFGAYNSQILPSRCLQGFWDLQSKKVNFINFGLEQQTLLKIQFVLEDNG